jgi:hypothetical protein
VSGRLKTSPKKVPVMKKLSVVLVLSVVAGPALAQGGRPFTPQLSCQSASGLVAANGAVVMNTGPNTYDRYVRDASACFATQVTRPAWVPAADRAQCFVGYTCIERERRGQRN